MTVFAWCAVMRATRNAIRHGRHCAQRVWATCIAAVCIVLRRGAVVAGDGVRSEVAEHDRAAGIGRRGERIAAQWLQRRGYRIMARNLRCGRSEADLLCRTPRGALVLVEVKTSARWGARPERRVDARKLRALGRLARRLTNRAERVRLDLVAVTFHEDGRPVVRHHPAIAWFRAAPRYGAR